MSQTYANGASTTLAAPATSGATTLTVASMASFVDNSGNPLTASFIVLIDQELIFVSSVSGTTLTVIRAYEYFGGFRAAASHAAGATVTFVVSYAALVALIAEQAVTAITAGSGSGLSGGGGPGAVSLALAASGVTAGSYTNAGITVDSFGRVTAAASGSSGGVTTFNTRDGAVTLTSGDVTTALTYTPLNPTTTQAANTVYAGPSSGSAAAPTFRSLVTVDIPSALNVTTLTPTTSGGYIAIEQYGGTVGTDEIRIYNDGTNSYIVSQIGITRIQGNPSAGNGTIVFQVRSRLADRSMLEIHDNSASYTNEFFVGYDQGSGFSPVMVVQPYTFQEVRVCSNIFYSWNASTNTISATPDTSLYRVAAGVLGPGKGAGSAGGWFQNPNQGRLANDATNATATMSSLSGLSVTLIAGRKYTGRLVLFANNSTAAEGLQFDFNGGSATMTAFEAGFASTPPGSGLVLGTLTTTALGTALTATTATTGDACYVIEFSLVCNAAGTFIPRFAEISHSTGTATVRAASFMEIQDSPT